MRPGRGCCARAPWQHQRPPPPQPEGRARGRGWYVYATVRHATCKCATILMIASPRGLAGAPPLALLSAPTRQRPHVGTLRAAPAVGQRLGWRQVCPSAPVAFTLKNLIQRTNRTISHACAVRTHLHFVELALQRFHVS